MKRFVAIVFSSMIYFTLAFANDPIMDACGPAMDIAESNLRIVLNKPATGKLPKEMTTE